MDEKYANIGTRVVLGRHSTLAGKPWPENWAEEMEKYVGQATEITSGLAFDVGGKAVVHVECDKGHFQWRVCNMTFISDPVDLKERMTEAIPLIELSEQGEWSLL